MIEKGKGGANTQTGLKFEKKIDILSLLSKTKGYTIRDKSLILFNGKEVARSYRKNALYKYLEEKGVDYKSIISKKWLPDEALYVIANNTLFIIEIKFQKVGGSVDEKLQTCDFKKKVYKKLMAPLNIDVEYIYILSNWFQHPRYKDTLEYVIDMGCQYYFEFLPLKKIGLPLPE
ncbi:MAG: hypothetical protein P4L74_03415 [Candidatus Doudnabacteria bacterium]|nr:hypothetical protein [Candidatus Doudnabacteria bacterium]